MVYVLWYTSVMKNGLVLGGGGAKGCYEVGYRHLKNAI